MDDRTLRPADGAPDVEVRPGADRPLRPGAPWVGREMGPTWSAVVAVVALALSGAAAAVVGAGARPSVVALGVAVAVTALCWDRPTHLAVLAGFLFPVQVLNGIPQSSLEVVHVVVVAAVVLRCRPQLPRATANLVLAFSALMVALALARLGFGVVRDPFIATVRFALLTLAGLGAATLLAWRVEAHRALFLGFLAGTTASSVVSLLQAAGDGLVRTGFYGANRFPGLAYEAPALSWQVAVSLMIGTAAATTAGPGRLRNAVVAQMVVCTAALLVCGAQGGLLGLLVAVVVCAFTARHEIQWRSLARRAFLPLLVVAVVGGIVVVAGLGATSITGLAGDPVKGHVNETARLRSIGYGVEQLVDNPFDGAGIEAYDARYDVRPHLLPLDAGVNTGVLGFLIGVGLMALLVVVLIRGPAERTASSLFGMALLSALFTLALLSPSGPFAGVERISMLLIGVALVQGASRPFGPVAVGARDDERHPDVVAGSAG